MLSLLFGQPVRESLNSGSANPAQWFIDWVRGGEKTTSGEAVNADSAMTIAAVWRAVNLLSSIIGTLPVHVYKRVGDGDRERLADHPVEGLLNRDADIMEDGEQNGCLLREAMQGHAILRGNGYAEIQRAGAKPVAIHLLNPTRCKPVWNKAGKLFYELDSGKSYLPAADVLHIRGYSDDGFCGKSFVHFARESLGLTIASEKYGGAFFGNGSRPAGVLQHPNQLKPEAAARLKKSWQDAHGGASKAGQTAVLEEGMTWQSIGMSAEDSQFLETRGFQVVDVARWIGVAPHLLFDLSRATFSNIEHQGIEFVNYSLRPWFVKWQAAWNSKLLTPSEREAGLYLEFQTAALIAGDIRSRYNAYRTGRDGGWLSVNDIRARENMNSIGAQGDIYLIPANMQDADKPLTNGQDSPADNQPAEETPAEEQQGNREAHVDALAAIFGRFIRRDAEACRKWSKKPDKFLDFLGWHYDQLGDELEKELAPAFKAAGLSSSVVVAAGYAESHREQLLELSGKATAAELPAKVDGVVSEWEKGQALKIAREVLGLT